MSDPASHDPASSPSPAPSPYSGPFPPTYPRAAQPSAQTFPAYLYPGGSYSLASIAVHSGGLGFVCALSLCLTYAWRSSYPALPFFIANLCFFHFMEYYATAAYNTRRAKVDAFILTNNGVAYTAAHTAAVVEGALEWWLSPGLKSVGGDAGWMLAGVTVGVWRSLLGFALVVLGQAVRSLAMRDAGGNFSHYVAQRHEEGHVLVSTGIYRLLRHPSYFGFFYWGLGTQILLANPVCFVVYAVVLWRFFNYRIRREEEYLIRFFGAEYVRYRKHTTTGIPFIP